MRPHCAADAVEALQTGKTVQVRPRGHSMAGLINDGEWVTLAPFNDAPQVGDLVLARIQGRRYTHFVLHMILECREDSFLIGSVQGRIDGWVLRDAIIGKVEQR